MSRVPPGDLSGRPLLEAEVPRSVPGQYCTVRWLPGGTWTGTCPGFGNAGRCKHVNRIRAQVDVRDVRTDGDRL